jgi:amidophosphoribosyltransferase
MCGIIGLAFANPNGHVNQALVDALTMLQHRGQDAAGIVTSNRNRLNLRKDNGTVAEVFTQENVIGLKGNIGIGHVRYPTAGGSCSAEAQPFYTNYPFGIALAHNGNLTNTTELLESMKHAYRHINTDSDSELLLNLFADELQRRQLHNITPDDIFDAVRIVMRKCKGSYSVVILINRMGLLAFRDVHGIRPLSFGKRETPYGFDYAIASESVAIDGLDFHFKLERDIEAGEAVFITSTGQLMTRQIVPSTRLTPCIFEYVYFARPDSILDGVKVYDARVKMGEKLALKIMKLFAHENNNNNNNDITTSEIPRLHDIDTVIPIPETSRTSALHCATILQCAYREGFVKNRYIARTFIMPGQETRRKTVRLKLNTIRSEFTDKVVLLVDDSIVRGTTSIELISMAREAGAKKVYFASAAPPVRYPNVYGIDIPTRYELVAFNRDYEEIQEALGADRVFYNDLNDMLEAVQSLNPSKLSEFEDSCFSGKYVTEEITEAYLQQLEQQRGGGISGRQSHSSSPALFLSSGALNKTNNNNNNTDTNTNINSSSSVKFQLQENTVEVAEEYSQIMNSPNGKIYHHSNNRSTSTMDTGSSCETLHNNT